jgi:membrane protease YdiL (CAAX protease family)
VESDPTSVAWFASGPLRLGWRLLVFLLVGWMLASLAAIVLPEGFTAGAAAMLAAAWGAGAAALALDRRGPGALGFYVSRSMPREAVVSLALGMGLAIVVTLMITALGGLRFRSEPGTAVEWMVGAISALGLFVLPAAAEEALLRGYPMQALAQAWGPGLALVVTSALFGAMHLPNPGVTALGIANVGAAGLFLGAVYLRTGSLWWATGAHLGWNWGLGYLADVPVSGLNVVDAPLVEAAALGPEWLGGGSFGPEGSVAATVVLLLAAAACWRGRWPRPEPAALARRPLALRVLAEDSLASPPTSAQS